MTDIALDRIALTEAPSPGRPLDVRHLRVGYGSSDVLSSVDFHLLRGSVTALVGPNGSGKSTLLKACTRLLKPRGGSVLLDGAEIHGLRTREVAKRLAILPQSPVAPQSLTVRDLVEQGRYPHAGPLRMLRRQDHEAIDRAIAFVQLNDFVDRDVDSLSGGERQRAWIAMALAQETPMLALDEPTTFLDIGHQFEVLELVQMLNRKHGVTVVMVVHELNHASLFADRVVVLRRGAVVAQGTPQHVFTPPLLRSTFGIEADVLSDGAGRPHIVPRRAVARDVAAAAM